MRIARLALGLFLVCPQIGFAQQNCTTIKAAIERLDCYDTYFMDAEAKLLELPDIESMITSLVGQTFYETDKSAGGARGWNVGRRSDVAKLLVMSQSKFEDRAEVEVEVHLGPSGGSFWVAVVEMLYVVDTGQWKLANAGMKGNFRYVPAS